MYISVKEQTVQMLAIIKGLTMYLPEDMTIFVPVYKLLDKLPLARSISNKIIVLEKQ